ncbi:hypothetical protein AB0I10_26400 [Streptomyces sp. NPDC050636]|uniref:hypothetical protein n=1 Tax=Streptomyces sp. NPDC050636 TaxID=3154510 RepID=UPI0034240796
MCWRYGRSTAPPLLRSSLRLFGLGTALAGRYWIGHVVRLFTSADWVLPGMVIVMGAHALLRAMAILVPTFAAVCRAIADVRTVWCLWPLWREAAVLACVMREARRSKLAGLPQRPFPIVPLGLDSNDSNDVRDEKAFLLQATEEYESSLIKTFGRRLDTIGSGSDRV